MRADEGRCNEKEGGGNHGRSFDTVVYLADLEWCPVFRSET